MSTAYYRIPPTPGKRAVYEWRIDDAQQGPAFVFLRGNSDVAQDSLFGLLADPALSCDESNVALRKDQLASFVTGGQAGAGGIAAQHVLSASLVDGKIRRMVGLDSVWFPMPFDPGLIKEFNPVPQNAVGIMVRNHRIEAFGISRGIPGTGSYWARERPDGSWIRLPIPVGHGPNIRGFGTFLAWPESVYQEFQEAKIQADPRLAASRVVHAGEREWRKTDSKWGPSTDFILNHSSTVHPGVLHIFDVKTSRHFVLRTGQSDSEVLLIEDDVVYYRSSDRLYRAEIRGDQPTGNRQIAQSELIRDAHWAFVTRKAAAAGEERH